MPERHTDFIFCTVGEEWGFVGTMVVLALLCLLILRLMLFCHIFPIFHKIFDGSAKQFAFVKLFGVT